MLSNNTIIQAVKDKDEDSVIFKEVYRDKATPIYSSENVPTVVKFIPPFKINNTNFHHSRKFLSTDEDASREHIRLANAAHTESGSVLKVSTEEQMQAFRDIEKLNKLTKVMKRQPSTK